MHTQAAPELHAALPFWRQIRWQLILAFVILAVLPVLIVAGITNAVIRERLTTQALMQLESVADLKADQISMWLNGSTTTLNFLLSPQTQKLAITLVDQPDQREVFQPAFNDILIDASSYGRDNDYTIRFEKLFLYTPDGEIIAASHANLIGRTVIRQPYFQASLSAEYLQAPYYEIGTNELVMVATQRIFDNNGNVKAVLAGQLDLSVLGTLIADRHGLSVTSETYLVSKESNYLLTPSRYGDAQLSRAYRSFGIDQALNGQNGNGIYENYHEPSETVVGVYRWIPELQVALLAETTQTEALSTADYLSGLNIIVTASMIVLAIATGLLIATRISRPIGQLTQIMGRIAGGDLDQRAQVRTKNEVGILASGFNHMAGQLQETLQSLEQRVATRTQELHQAMQDLEQRTTIQGELLEALNRERAVVRDLSMPIIPISKRTLVAPLIGTFDSERLLQLREQTLYAIQRSQAKNLVLDITGVPVVDSHVGQGLMHVVDAGRLLGTQVVLVGVRPEVAQSIVGLGMDLRSIRTFSDLQGALNALEYQQR